MILLITLLALLQGVAFYLAMARAEAIRLQQNHKRHSLAKWLVRSGQLQ